MRRIVLELLITKKTLKGTLHTELFQIDGIGEKTAIHLLKQFGSIESIKKVGIDELQKVWATIKQD